MRASFDLNLELATFQIRETEILTERGHHKENRGLGFASGFRVLGFRVLGFRFRVWGLTMRVVARAEHAGLKNKEASRLATPSYRGARESNMLFRSLSPKHSGLQLPRLWATGLSAA